MSDIPAARAHLEAIRNKMETAHLDYYVEHIEYVLSLMVREKYKERISMLNVDPEKAKFYKNG
tara:strand:- start:60 stop:248 length:189 start_codon:yes stop_codon:yes gene_type:complete